jgi:hypothetical protein
MPGVRRCRGPRSRRHNANEHQESLLTSRHFNRLRCRRRVGRLGYRYTDTHDTQDYLEGALLLGGFGAAIGLGIDALCNVMQP